MIDTLDDKVFEFAYRMALDDATRQNAYRGRGKNSKTVLRKCTEARSRVKSYIDDVIAGKRPEFEKAERDIEEAFERFSLKDPGVRFTFGNAQKLLNMTSKYMFMATYDRPKLRDNFKCCHCPMDSIMVEAAISRVNNGDVDFNEIKNEVIRNKLKQRGWKGYLRKSWSMLERSSEGVLPEQYVAFQEIISILARREGLSPIAYDFFVWGNSDNEAETS